MPNSLFTIFTLLELMKISSCADKRIWDLLVQNGEALIQTRFGRADGAPTELKAIADEICWRGIKVMLEVGFYSLVNISVLYTLYSSNRPTCTRSDWIESSPSVTACLQR